MKVGVFVTSLLLTALAWPQGRTTVEIDTGNAQLSGAYNGGIGFTAPDTGAGIGFRYERGGLNHLYFGSLLVANSPNSVHDHFYSRPFSALHNDWVIRDTLVDVFPLWFGAHELFRCALVDTSRPTQAQGIQVRSYWGGRGAPLTGYDDFVIVRYDVQNRSNNTMSGVYVGVMCDFDLNGNATDDWGRTDSARRLVYMWPSAPPNVAVGVKLLQPWRVSNLSLIDAAYYVYPPTQMSETTKFDFLSGTIHLSEATRPYDYSICTAYGPFSLAAGQEVWGLGFAIIGALDTFSLKVHADSAQAWWSRHWRPGIAEENVGRLGKSDLLEVQGSPFRRHTVIRYMIQDTRYENGDDRGRRSESEGSQKQETRLLIYDVSGQAVKRFDISSHVPHPSHYVTWDGTDDAGRPLPAGVYFVRLETPTDNYTKKVLLLR